MDQTTIQINILLKPLTGSASIQEPMSEVINASGMNAIKDMMPVAIPVNSSGIPPSPITEKYMDFTQ